METNPYQDAIIAPKTLAIGQKHLTEAMLSLLDGRRYFSEISVSELCKEAKISRTAFYHYYGNTRDVLRDIEDAFLPRCSDYAQKMIASWPSAKAIESTILEFMDYLAEEKERLQVLLSPYAEDTQFLVRWKNVFRYHLFNFYANNPYKEFYLDVIATCLTTGIAFYAKKSMAYDREQFVKDNVKLILKAAKGIRNYE